jgi:hypothetical protein
MRAVSWSPLRVTFDSNTWQCVVRPDKFAKDPRHSPFLLLNKALRCGRIQGFLVDTMATLEGVPRADRGKYLASDKPHPGLAPILVDRLRDAARLDVCLMHAPRIGLDIPRELAGMYYVQSENEAGQRQNRASPAIRAIEAKGVGKTELERIGRQILQRLNRTGHWRDALDQPASAQENEKIADAVGEWADEDALAAHYGYGNHYFCTEDLGKSATEAFGQSILDPARRAWLTATYGIQFVTMVELAAKI